MYRITFTYIITCEAFTKYSISRYNLKRRVASLPPLTSEIFAEKVLANQATAAATAARASYEQGCTACGKRYFSENAYMNHLTSQKHKEKINKLRNHNDLAASDVETGSVISSSFSLGEPLETDSMASTIDVQSLAENLKSTDLAQKDDTHMEDPNATPKIGTSTSSSTPPANPQEHLVKVELNQCIFCNQMCEDIDTNLSHMESLHGMFIPEKEYLVDLSGLFTHLHSLIFDLHECLYCHKVKGTAMGIQTHMRDRGHCMIAYSTEEDMLDIGEFYDFRSTYSDDEEDSEADEDDQTSARVKLGKARNTKTTVHNDEGEEIEMTNMEEGEDGWESDGSLSSVPTDEIGSVPIDDHSHRYKTLDQHRHHSHSDPRPHRTRDGYHSHAHTTPRAVYHDEFEMHLPSGRIAGHRSMNKYFRQNLYNRPSLTEQAQQRRAVKEAQEADDATSEEEDTDLSSQPNLRDKGRQLIARQERDLALQGVSDDKRREVRIAEKRMQKQERRAFSKYKAGNEKRANSQKHFRVSQISLSMSLLFFTKHYSLIGSIASIVYIEIMFLRLILAHNERYMSYIIVHMSYIIMSTTMYFSFIRMSHISISTTIYFLLFLTY